MAMSGATFLIDMLSESSLSVSEYLRDQLIPGLPDPLVLELICPKLSWRDFYNLSSVSPRWLRAIRAHRVYDARVRCNSTETLVATVNCHLSGDCSNNDFHTIVLYSKRDEVGYKLPPIPGLPSGIPFYCQCVSLDGKIYCLGGAKEMVDWSCSREVYVLDLAGQREWKQCASMRERRSNFGVGVMDGKIYVFGGISAFMGVRGSEVYDPKVNAWSDIKPMPTFRHNHHVVLMGEELFVRSGRFLSRYILDTAESRLIDLDDNRDEDEGENEDEDYNDDDGDENEDEDEDYDEDDGDENEDEDEDYDEDDGDENEDEDEDYDEDDGDENEDEDEDYDEDDGDENEDEDEDYDEEDGDENEDEDEDEDYDEDDEDEDENEDYDEDDGDENEDEDEDYDEDDGDENEDEDEDYDEDDGDENEDEDYDDGDEDEDDHEQYLHWGWGRDPTFTEVYHPVKDEWRFIEKFGKDLCDGLFVTGGKFHVMTARGTKVCVYVHKPETQSWALLHESSFADMGLANVARMQIYAIVVVDGELLAAVTLYYLSGDFPGPALLQSNGVSSEQKIVWKIVAEGTLSHSRFDHCSWAVISPYFLCPIEL